MLQTKNKKIVTLTLFIFQFLSWTPLTFAQESEQNLKEKKSLLVTAYYSPQPNQDFYIRGSYEADMALNGEGVQGADGTQVYVGMLAAPSTYSFGTKVYIPGLGVGEVHDRGGAIEPGADFDRIDVWMGYGEEGLARALNWGSRLVEGEIYSNPNQTDSGFDYSWVKSELSEATIKNLQNKAPTPSEILPSAKKEEIEENDIKNTLVPELGKGAEGEAVKKLQNTLNKIGYFPFEETGKYDEKTVEAVFSFQLQAGILQSKKDSGAGYFGQKTHQALIAAANKKVLVLEKIPEKIEKEVAWTLSEKPLPSLDTLSALELAPVQKELAFDKVLSNTKIVQENPVMMTSFLELNDKGEKVLQLQEKLIEQGYLATNLNTGYFGPKTSEALIKFQLKQGIIKDEKDPLAGKVEDKTSSALHFS